MTLNKKIDDYNAYDKDRRKFLKKIISFFFYLISFIFVITGVFYLKPSKPKKKNYKFYEIDSDNIPREGVKKIEVKINDDMKMKIFLVRYNSLIALSPVCTHLGCFVNFDKNANEFICPCHGGCYDIEGNVLAGPPRQPLHRLPVKIENDKIFIGLKL